MQEEQILQGLPNQIFAGVANIAGFTNNEIFADPNVCTAQGPVGNMDDSCSSVK